MSKVRKLFQKNLVMRDWLGYKPYEQSSDYDRYYLKMANEVLNLLKKNSKDLKEGGVEDSNLKLLSIVLTSYFEDYASEIGIWEVFVKTNQHLYDYELPFYDLSGYDTDYLNWQDISYLTWHFSYKRAELVFSPMEPFLENIGKTLFVFFEEKLDDAWATDFYTDYFKVPDGKPFLDFHEKLEWLAINSYLLGMEFESIISKNVDEYLEEEEEIDEEDNLAFGLFLGELQGKISLTEKSSFSALSAVDWFAELVDCSEVKRKEIRDLYKFTEAIGLFEKKDEAFFYLRLYPTEELLKIKNPSDESFNDRNETNTLLYLDLVWWNNEWDIAFTARGVELDEEEIKEIKKSKKETQSYYYILSSDSQQRIDDAMNKMQEMFLKFFSKSIVFLKDEKAFHNACNDFANFYKLEDSKITSFLNTMKNWKGKEASEGSGIALLCPPQSGIARDDTLARCIQLLTKENCNQKEKRELFHSMFVGRELKGTFQYLLENYPTHNLEFLNPNSGVDVEKYAKFLFRFLSPFAFVPRRPFISFL